MDDADVAHAFCVFRTLTPDVVKTTVHGQGGRIYHIRHVHLAAFVLYGQDYISNRRSSSYAMLHSNPSTEMSRRPDCMKQIGKEIRENSTSETRIALSHAEAPPCCR